ncbi:MAG TPA: GNAT family N-acetyltransferase [Terriglobales bacterium]|nr:GNAT family N-acetyltransferase [Terriglobales bacterium]
MANPSLSPQLTIRELETVADLARALELERNVWQCEASDVVPITLAVASRAAGSIWLGAFDRDELVGFAFALPSFDAGETAFHSHTVGVRDDYQSSGVGYQLKLAQRKRALAVGIKKMTWTFDPLRSRNAHLNFCKLGVISDRYEVDFYGTKSSSPLHSNSTDRFWVTWHMADPRVEQRLKGKDPRSEMLDALAHLDPLVRFNGNGRPAEAELVPALARQRIAIEIPGDIGRIEGEDIALGREWRLATRRAFTESLKAGFVVKDFCRSIRGQQGPGAYLLERLS